MSHATVLVAVDGPQEKVEQQVAYEMEPFDENGEFFRNGSRWDYWTIGGRWSDLVCEGNIIQVKSLDLAKLLESQKSDAFKNWHEWKADKDTNDRIKEFIYGVKQGESIEQYVERRVQHAFPAHGAFLRNRRWHENERMGWWGMTAATECEVGRGPIVGKCLVRDVKTKSEIVVWKSDQATWGAKFYDRFVKPLPPETFLVTVDYHV